MIGTERSIAENLARVRDSIAEAALHVGRRPEEITLVGVSKTHAPEAIVAAIGAGLRHVGENRVQEAAEKFPTVRQLLSGDAAPVFHMIGHLQTNKAGSAVGLFDRVDSVDSLKLAQALSRRLDGPRELPVLIEVYVGNDPSRPGVRPDQLVETVGRVLEVPRLRVEGLMTVAPLDADVVVPGGPVQPDHPHRVGRHRAHPGAIPPGHPAHRHVRPVAAGRVSGDQLPAAIAPAPALMH